MDTAHSLERVGILLLLTTPLACGDAPPGPDGVHPADAAPASVALSPRDLLLLEGQSVALSATVRDSSGAVLTRDVEWTALQPEIVTVSSGGLVRGRGLGTGSVVAGVGSVADTVAVRVRIRFASVSAGAAHTCGVTTQGSPYCWGWNREGRLGTGSVESVGAPARVASAATFSRVTAGWEITCGLSATGAACWGSNRSGQVGSVAKADALVPAPVANDPSFVAIATHTTHSCGLAERDRAAWCWGAGWTGQRGTGDASGGAASPITGGLAFRALDVGWLFSCGITTAGDATCWGTNDAGQLGRPDAPDECVWPDGSVHPCATGPVAVASALRFDSLAVGTSHACALVADGSLQCWGRNDAGQLGDGSTDGAQSPRAVGGGPFTAVTAGNRHTCALDTDGVAWCWGDNALGALGVSSAGETCGGAPCSRVPVRVETALRFRLLSASRGEGGAHSCGIAADGLAYCWGSNAHGQLGTDEPGAGGVLPRLVAGQTE